MRSWLRPLTGSQEAELLQLHADGVVVEEYLAGGDAQRPDVSSLSRACSPSSNTGDSNDDSDRAQRVRAHQRAAPASALWRLLTGGADRLELLVAAAQDAADLRREEVRRANACSP